MSDDSQNWLDYFSLDAVRKAQSEDADIDMMINWQQSSRVYGGSGAPPKICARTFPKSQNRKSPKSQIAEIANRRNRKSPKSQISKIASLRSLRYISVTESQGCFAILENIPFSVERTQGNLPDRLPIDLMIIRS